MEKTTTVILVVFLVAIALVLLWFYPPRPNIITPPEKPLISVLSYGYVYDDKVWLEIHISNGDKEGDRIVKIEVKYNGTTYVCSGIGVLPEGVNPVHKQLYPNDSYVYKGTEIPCLSKGWLHVSGCFPPGFMPKPGTDVEVILYFEKSGPCRHTTMFRQPEYSK